MDSIQVFIVAALAIEGLVSWGKTIIIEKRIQWPVILSLCFSILLVYDLQLNLLSLLSYTEQCPIIGMTITAIALSRGTNYFYEFYSRLTSWKQTGGNE